MKPFSTIEKLDTCILYLLELTSSLSILLLAFGLIASMANVLTKGSVLSDNLLMQRIWAWTQCIAIDASVAGTIIRTFRYHQEQERVKTWIYGLLSALLLFTAAIVSNIEAVQQTLNITLEQAYIHVFVPVELLIWIRSLAIVLLIVAHALRHVQIGKPQAAAPVQPQEQYPVKLDITPELLAALRQMLTQEQTTVIEEQELPQQIEAPKEPLTQEEEKESTLVNLPAICGKEEDTPAIYSSQFQSKEMEIYAILSQHRFASVQEVTQLASCSERTAKKWMQRYPGYEAEA